MRYIGIDVPLDSILVALQDYSFGLDLVKLLDDRMADEDFTIRAYEYFKKQVESIEGYVL